MGCPLTPGTVGQRRPSSERCVAETLKIGKVSAIGKHSLTHGAVGQSQLKPSVYDLKGPEVFLCQPVKPTIPQCLAPHGLGAAQRLDLVYDLALGQVGICLDPLGIIDPNLHGSPVVMLSDVTLFLHP